MYAVVQQIFPWAFFLTWFGGTAVMGFRYRAKQRAYLHTFPPVEGVPLDMAVVLGPRRVMRVTFEVLRRPQADPEQERLRRDMWRHYRYAVLWALGFPLTVFAVVALVIVTGHAPHSQ